MGSSAERMRCLIAPIVLTSSVRDAYGNLVAVPTIVNFAIVLFVESSAAELLQRRFQRLSLRVGV
jgi:hypothetical protein